MSRILSPNIVYSETDLSFVPSEVPQSDFLIIGTTPKGRYFVPTLVDSYQNYVLKFGEPRLENNKITEYVGLTVYELLNSNPNANTNIVAIAGTEDYNVSRSFNLMMTSGSTTSSVANIYLTEYAKNLNASSITVTGDASNFTLVVNSSSTELRTYQNLSLKPDNDGSTFWIGSKRNPIGSVTELFYVESIVTPTAKSASFAGIVNLDTSLNTVDLFISSSVINGVTFSGYNSARTPAILSSEGKELFYFETLNQGDASNKELLIGIENITLASESTDPDETWTTFDIVTYAYDDYDDRNNISSPKETNRFQAVTLNPTSNKYILKVIGDMKEYFNSSTNQVETEGVYPNVSATFRVVLINEGAENDIPYGFRRYPLSTNLFGSAVPRGFYLYPTSGSGVFAGVNFNDSDVKNYRDFIFTRKPKSTSNFYYSGVDAQDFYLNGNGYSPDNVRDRKFVLGFYGGSNGLDPAISKKTGEDATTSNTFGLSFANLTSTGYLAFKKALDLVSDREYIRFKTLVMPGLNLFQHGNIHTYAFNMASSPTRGDIWIVTDAGLPSHDANTIKSTTAAFDSSYASAYAPWFAINYTSIGLGMVNVPASVLMPRVIFNNDANSRPWIAPFGFERGGLSNSGTPLKRFNLTLRDTLHEARVNAIVQFQGEPFPIVMNQLTLQRKNTAFSNINVRRLLNEIKITFDGILRKYLGRPLGTTQRNQLTQEINDYLGTVQSENGLNRFLAKFDETINTPDVEDQGLIRGVVYLEPTKSIRGFQIGFVVTNSGVQFSE